MNSEISIERQGQKVLSFYSTDKKRRLRTASGLTLAQDATPRAPSGPSHKDALLHEFMVTHLHQGLTPKELSEFLGYSEKYCSDFFILHMGKPFSMCLKGLRLQTAKRLLQNSEQNLTEIAQAIGFQDQFSFSHFFKKATGISPRQFRETLLLPGSQI